MLRRTFWPDKYKWLRRAVTCFKLFKFLVLKYIQLQDRMGPGAHLSVLKLSALTQVNSSINNSNLGGVPVDAPPRQQHAQIEQPQLSQYSGSEQQPSTAWAPKTNTTAGTQSLGSSILNSIPPQSFGSATPGVSDALPSASPRAPQQSSLGNSHSTFGHSPVVIPSPHQQVCHCTSLVCCDSKAGSPEASSLRRKCCTRSL